MSRNYELTPRMDVVDESTTDSIGSIYDAFSDLRYVALKETLDFSTTRVAMDEAVATASMMNPERVEVLQEVTLRAIGEKIKKFFDRILNAVRSIIKKLEAWLDKALNKTDAWVKNTKPSFDQAVKKHDRDFKAFTHQYQTNYIMKTVPDAITKMMDFWEQNVTANTVTVHVGRANSTVGINGHQAPNGSVVNTVASKVTRETPANQNRVTSGYTNNRAQIQGTQSQQNDRDSAAEQAKIDEFDRSIKNIGSAVEQFNVNLLRELSGALQVQRAEGVNELIEGMANRAVGDLEGTDRNFGITDMQNMFNTVTGYGDHIKKISDMYGRHLKSLEKYSTNIGTPYTEDQGRVGEAGNRELEARYNAVIKMTGQCETVFSAVQQRDLKLAADMVAEYMNICTRYINNNSARFKQQQKEARKTEDQKQRDDARKKAGAKV